jgi:glycosyltransferase involved in cell wall biosynthesis
MNDTEQPQAQRSATRGRADAESKVFSPCPGVPASPRPVRVLVVSHNCVGESNRKRVEALARVPGLEVSLLTPRWWYEEGRHIDLSSLSPKATAPGVAWHIGRTVATNNGTRHIYVDRLFMLLRQFRPDVIDLHEEPFSLVALQTLLGRDLLAPRAAFAFYSAVNVNVRWRLPYRLVENVVLARADGAYAPNSDVPAVLRAKGLRAPVVRIPIGVDAEQFANAAPVDLDGWLSAAPRPYVGFLGRLEPVKGLDYLVAAAGRLRNTGTIVLAGDGPERGRLEMLVSEHGLQERVRFLPGIPFNSVPGFLKSLDALVLPSITIPPLQKEQFGRVLVEAMAAGVPVLGSSSGAIPEVIGDAGLVVPERDSAALARGIDRLASDPALRADLVERGRRRVAECFAWSLLARQTADFYATAIACRRGARARSSFAPCTTSISSPERLPRHPRPMTHDP